MQSNFIVTKPDEIEFTMTVTMRLSEWEKIAGQLQSSTWPGSKLVAAIRDMSIQANRSFYPKPITKEDEED